MPDVDTDLIMPAQFLTCISRDGWGRHLFQRLKENNPDFPLNQDCYRGAQILAAGTNFGCGSSREHAVWALLDAGIRVVISSSFADIFTNNSAKNGLLLVTLSPVMLDQVLRDAAEGTLTATVDLESQTVSTPDGRKMFFDFDPFRKHCLLNGLDDIDYIRSRDRAIADFRGGQEAQGIFSTILDQGA